MTTKGLITKVLLSCLLFSYTQARVLRIDAGSNVSVQKSQSITTLEATTISTDIEQEDFTTKAPENAEETTITALSRDEDASIKITAAELDPAPGTVEGIEIELFDEIEEENEDNSKLRKSEKLLLLSAPKLHEQPKEEEEENVEESEEIIADATTETTTETTTSTIAAEEVTTVVPVTKLHAINETSPNQTEAKNVENPAVAKKVDDTPVIPAVQPAEPKNSNAASAVLIETESDYVLVDSDFEEFGTFAHVDSDLHLQPIVQSVEIVPTSVDDPLIISYVHSW
ncbi:uncharacterized protein LOC119671213 [Teleopsis dalmanni]|uniref:uncharacterized protein LOC119671213 n=1 Tax=Teleopsis dalmanni TaxID=139649 RepID=UPI0018CF40C0|nr:uncharacterized protein LOC119671213 [Teleopsis dalmanni]